MDDRDDELKEDGAEPSFDPTKKEEDVFGDAALVDDIDDGFGQEEDHLAVDPLRAKNPDEISLDEAEEEENEGSEEEDSFDDIDEL